ncbi:thymidine phosphorylase [Candidatus Roizmanbacteria bacterium]|nr:MAG: thymidine phosphorylase [Candidatus Roizmanbacteria bacterium]
MAEQTNLLLAKEAIRKKLRGRQLTYKEIYALMDEISSDRLGDVLTTYFAAAGFKEGFTEEELYYMTKAMVETGTQLRFKGVVADKHSIGGIAGARTTMIVVPIVVAAGFTMPKTSSRAITSPAGTADVMEVLAKVNFTPEHVEKIVRDVGGCIIWGGHLGIAPADDIIIKVEEPLSFESFDKIIVSIMAKKVAVSTNHLVIDIPIGRTMKVKYEKDADLVKKKFEGIAKRFGIKIDVDVNSTTEPEGHGIGPTLEAIDVLKVLQQDETRPLPLENRAIRLAGKLLDLCYKTTGQKKRGTDEAKELLKNGKALEVFRKILKAQYGDPDVTWKKLKTARFKQEIKAKKSGTINHINNFNLNAIAKILGAPSDQKAGIELHKRSKDEVRDNDVLLTLHSSKESNIREAVETLHSFPIYNIV